MRIVDAIHNLLQLVSVQDFLLHHCVDSRSVGAFPGVARRSGHLEKLEQTQPIGREDAFFLLDESAELPSDLRNKF